MRPPTLSRRATTFEHLLERIARCIEQVPKSLMRAAGWKLVRVIRIDGSDDPSIKHMEALIDTAILDSWPAAVRLTCDEAAAAVLIWRDSSPRFCSAESGPFPARADIEHALRTLHAVGTARANYADDAIAQFSASAGNAEAIGLANRALDEDQIHFEYVAAALRDFTRRD